MSECFDKTRYIDDHGYGVLHTRGVHAGESALPYLHYSSRFQLMYFKRGTGSIKIEGRRYSIKEGDIVLLNPTELFQLSVDDKDYHERISLSIKEALFSSYPDASDVIFSPFSKRKKGVGNKIPAEVVRDYGIDECIEAILLHTASQEPTGRLLAFCKIAELLTLLCEVAKKDLELVTGQVVSNPLIGDVLEYLNIHFAEDIDISGVAANFGIDKSYLSHLFKEHVGMSLWTYVILRRIQLFNELAQGDDTIENCAYRAGFKNYSNFYRIYKKYMTITPAEYRRQIKTKDKVIDTDIQLF